MTSFAKRLNVDRSNYTTHGIINSIYDGFGECMTKVHTDTACCDVVLVLVAAVTTSSKDVRLTRALPTVRVTLETRRPGHVAFTRCMQQ